MSTTEIKSMTFEVFMTRAYRLDNRITRPSKSEFKNLVRLEEKDENINKKLQELKNRMHKACDIFSKQNLKFEEQEKITILMGLIAQVYSSENIYSCAKVGNSITERFK